MDFAVKEMWTRMRSVPIEYKMQLKYALRTTIANSVLLMLAGLFDKSVGMKKLSDHIWSKRNPIGLRSRSRKLRTHCFVEKALSNK